MRLLVAVSLVALATVACSSSSDGSPAAPVTSDADVVDDGDRDGDAGGSDPTDAGAPDAPVDAGPASSGGNGGLTCTSTGNLPGGRTYCLTTIGGAELKLALPQGGTGPLSVALYLHGDGAGAYKSDGAMKALLPWADAHHAIFVSVLSPNRCAWWQVPTQTDCSDGSLEHADREGVNADALREVLEAVRAAYDVTNGPLFYYGSSGGSIFLTRSFLRRFGDRFPGVFALNCGGEKADRAFAWDPADATKRASTVLSYTYGDQDFLKADIEAAIPFYEGLGFPSESKVIAGAAHCAFDGHGRAAEVWSAFLGE